jgi:hypothetical protein
VRNKSAAPNFATGRLREGRTKKLIVEVRLEIFVESAQFLLLIHRALKSVSMQNNPNGASRWLGDGQIRLRLINEILQDSGYTG